MDHSPIRYFSISIQFSIFMYCLERELHAVKPFVFYFWFCTGGAHIKIFEKNSDKKIPTKKFRRKNSDEKIPTKKFRRKNLDEKKWTKKNWGQGTGARHGRCGGKARVINGDSWGAKPPRPPPGGKARVSEIPEGGKPPQTPPRHHFKKFALQGQIF